jgi:hypothetical protein
MSNQTIPPVNGYPDCVRGPSGQHWVRTALRPRFKQAKSPTPMALFTQCGRKRKSDPQSDGAASAPVCHHNLEIYLAAYIESAGLADDPKGPLFRTIGRGTGL